MLGTFHDFFKRKGRKKTSLISIPARKFTFHMWFVASLHLSAKYRKAEGGDTGPRSCKLQRISPGAENDGRAAVVMETPSGGGAWEDGDPLVLLLKITWQAEAPPPLPLPPIQPSRAAAPVSYYKMAAKAPPSTGNPWTSHGKISFFIIIFTLWVALWNPPATPLQFVFRTVASKLNELFGSETRRPWRERIFFSLLLLLLASEAPLWHLCFWRGEECACGGSGRRPSLRLVLHTLWFADIT